MIPLLPPSLPPSFSPFFPLSAAKAPFLANFRVVKCGTSEVESMNTREGRGEWLWCPFSFILSLHCVTQRHAYATLRPCCQCHAYATLRPCCQCHACTTLRPYCQCHAYTTLRPYCQCHAYTTLLPCCQCHAYTTLHPYTVNPQSWFVVCHNAVILETVASGRLAFSRYYIKVYLTQ